jgi:hypothetical protein
VEAVHVSQPKAFSKALDALLCAPADSTAAKTLAAPVVKQSRKPELGSLAMRAPGALFPVLFLPPTARKKSAELLPRCFLSSCAFAVALLGAYARPFFRAHVIPILQAF